MSDNKRSFYVASSNEKIGFPSGQDESYGIAQCTLDLENGALEIVATFDTIPTCQYLAVAESKQFLYATWHDRDAEGDKRSSVNAFAIDPDTGALTFINRQYTNGDSPCYVKHSGDYVLAVNYTGPEDQGSVCVFPVNTDGSLGEKTTYIKHEGSSVVVERQQHSHPHMITTNPSGELVLVPDLGTDHVWVYRLDRSSGKLIPFDTPRIPLSPGSGPRHLAFHPTLDVLYVINEIGNTITSYQIGDTTFEEIEDVPALPAGYTDTSYCADIHITPDGKFLYGSNRGHDSIVAFSIDPTSGKLTLIGFESVNHWPRGFVIDPTGTYLISASQRGHTVDSYKINAETGVLTPTGHKIDVPGAIAMPSFL